MRLAPFVLIALLALAAAPPPAHAGKCGSGFSFSIGIGSSSGFRHGGYTGTLFRHGGYHPRVRHCSPRIYHRPFRRHCSSVRTYRHYGLDSCGSSYFRLSFPIYRSRSYTSCGPRYSGYSTCSPRYVVVNPAYEQPDYRADRGASDEYHEWQMQQRIEALRRELADTRAEEEARRTAPLVAQRDGAPAEADAIDLADEAAADDEEWGGEAGPAIIAAAEPAEPVERTAAVDAWRALDGGRYSDARDAFAALVEAQPSNTGARIGLALSWAWLGEALAAEFEMKRALRADPFGVADERTLMESRRSDLVRLARVLRTGSTGELRTHGRWTLIASIEYLAGEREEAQRSIKRARRLGETGQAPKNLWRLLGLSEKAPVVVAERE